MEKLQLSIRYIIFVCLLIFFIYGSSAFCDSTLPGTTRGTFLKWMSGVRSSAMGNAFIGEADDLSAVFFNPSGLSQIDSIYLASSYSNLFAGINFANGSIVIPMNKNTFAFSYNYINFGAIEETTVIDPQGSGQTFTPQVSEFNYSLSRLVDESVSVGGNIRLINEEIAGNKSTGYGLDLGAHLKISDAISFGLSARNIIGSLGGETIPKNYGAGISRKFDNLRLNIDFNVPNDNGFQINLGAEYNYKDQFYLRLGASDAGSSSGIGVKYQKALFDYAYIVYGDLGPTHRISVSFPLSARLSNLR